MSSFNKLTVMGVLSLTMLAGCDNGVGSNITPPSTSIQASMVKKTLGDRMEPIRMGSGFDMTSNTATSSQSCLIAPRDQNNMIVANPTTQITLSSEQGLSQLQNSLNVDVSGKYGGDRFAVSAEAEFANSSKDTAYTTNIRYLYKYAGQTIFKDGSLGQGDAALTPVAASFVHTDQTFFREMCGNGFIDTMDAGVTLGINLALSFNTHMDQEKFMAEAKADVGLANVSALLQQAAAKTNVHVGFSLSAIQLGGEPQKLGDIFGKVESSTGNFPFVDCGSVGGSSQEACDHMTTAIIAYSQTLPSQMSKADGTIDFNKLYYSNGASVNYSRLGIVVGAPEPSSEVLQTMQTLTVNFDKTMADYNFVTHYLSGLHDYLDIPTINSLQDAKERLTGQILQVYQSTPYKVLNCYKGYVGFYRKSGVNRQ